MCKLSALRWKAVNTPSFFLGRPKKNSKFCVDSKRRLTFYRLEHIISVASAFVGTFPQQFLDLLMPNRLILPISHYELHYLLVGKIVNVDVFQGTGLCCFRQSGFLGRWLSNSQVHSQPRRFPLHSVVHQLLHCNIMLRNTYLSPVLVNGDEGHGLSKQCSIEV